jgi:hypothetical protein
MATDRMTLKALLEKGLDGDLLREMLGFCAASAAAIEADATQTAQRSGAELGSGQPGHRLVVRAEVSVHTPVIEVPLPIRSREKLKKKALSPASSASAARGHWRSGNC